MTQKNENSVFRAAGLGALLLLTLVNLFNYLDRYILMALSPAIKRDLALSDTQVGLLATAFMYSYFLISPVFGWLGDKKPRYPLMALGVGLWSLATMATGMVRSYLSLLACRFHVGVGEAAYGAISPSVITDLYPKLLRGRAFAIFFLAIPVGSALGYLLGGILENWVGWRSAFLVAGAPGLLLAFGLIFLKEPERGAQDETVGASLSLGQTAAALWQNKNYVLTVLGYCAYTFVLGGVAAWIPHYIERYLGVSAAEGNQAFGAITVIAGFLGTFVGGAWADRWAKTGTDAYLKLSAFSMFAALPIFFLVMSAKTFSSFCVLVFLLEFLLFLSTGPVNAQIVNCVLPSIRTKANAAAIFSIHLFGDAISVPLVGFISDRSNLHHAMMMFGGVILLSGVIWGAKAILYWETLAWPEGALHLPENQCHRGLFGNGVQENTLAAFQAAARAGAKMVELDVHLAQGKIPVVVHDKDILRISGRNSLVKDLSPDQLRVWAQVPTLQDVLKGCPGLAVNIELKSNTAFTDGLEEAVAQVVKDCGAEGRVIFSSFNPLALRRISRYLPMVPRALLVTEESSSENKIYLKKMWLAFLARPHMVNYDRAFLSEALAQEFTSRNIPFAVWTVESPEEARKFLALGAKSIISSKATIL